MKRIVVYGICLCVLLLAISCQEKSGKATVSLLLKEAEIRMEQHPDSAFCLLSGLHNIQRLNKKLRYKHCLLLVQAKDKCYKDICSDTLIFKAMEYYKRNNDNERAALAAFYCGRVLQEQEKYDEALQTYFNAANYLKQINNNKLSGLVLGAVGDIYYYQFLPDKAVAYFRQAKGLFHQSKNYTNELAMYSLIGNCLLMQEKTDSAFVYYYTALALADKYKLRHEQTELRENIGVACNEIGEWAKAEKLIKEAFAFASDSLDKAHAAYNLALLFEQQSQSDSAVFYIQKSLTSFSAGKDNYLAANIYQTWSEIEEEQQNHQAALKLHQRYCDYLALIFDENSEKAVREIEAKYNYQLIEKRNRQLTIERQQIVLLLLVIVLVSVVIIFWRYKRFVQNEKKLKEAERKIYKIRKLAQNFDEREHSLRNILLKHFEILKKTALLEKSLKKTPNPTGKYLLQSFNEAIYEQKNLDWKALYRTLNNLSGALFKQMRNKLSVLDESEFRICCLVYIGFSNTEIAIILNYSANTISSKRSSIRNKLNIEAFGNIQQYLKQMNNF